MTGGGSAAPETITVLLDAQGRPLTKSFRRLGGKIVKGTYPNAAEFRAVVVEVDGIASLAAVLDAVVTRRPCRRHPGRPGQVLPAERLTGIPPAAPQEGLGRHDRRPDLAARRSASTTSKPTTSTATR